MIPIWVLVIIVGVLVIIVGCVYSVRTSGDFDLVTPIVGLLVSVVGVALCLIAVAWRLGVWYAQG